MFGLMLVLSGSGLAIGAGFVFVSLFSLYIQYKKVDKPAEVRLEQKREVGIYGVLLVVGILLALFGILLGSMGF
jgi:hypothetical protein